MEDSDDGEADGEAEPHQDDESGSGGGGASSGGEELSAYELERRKNTRRNQARLKELGLDGPIVPPRPSPIPRQPRPPRAPEGPRRES
eukprot:5558643-Prymnesium_polylepis.1